MRRLTKTALLSALLATLAGGVLAACTAEDHSGHDHGPGDGHDTPKAETK